MGCFDNYITISSATPSRSGRYAINLKGVTEDLLSDLIKPQHADLDDLWSETIYPEAIKNLVSDATKGLQDKFFVNHKLVSRETSEFKQELNSGADLSGIKIVFDLPRYGKIRIVSFDVWADQSYLSPEAVFYIYDTDENGDLLATITEPLTEGKNTIFVDQEFETDEIFVAYDPSLISVRKTQNKLFRSCEYWDTEVCESCFAWGRGTFSQIKGGGINLVYNVFCSVEKFVCQNINFFESAFYYRIGLEIFAERVIGENLNKSTAMTEERARQLFDFYNDQYRQELMNSLKAHKIYEDEFCFECKGVVGVQTTLP